MKKIILLTYLCYSSLLVFGQHATYPDLLTADSTWTKEIIRIPFGFAGEIKHTGYEDIRFAKGWGDKESSQFWSYAFVWKVDLTTTPSEAYLEENLKYYFHGLMAAVNKEKDKIIPETLVFLKKKEGAKLPTFIGTVKTHDSFKTKRVMTLNVHIEIYFCKKEQRYLPLFRFSQQPFGTKVWSELKTIQLHKNACIN